LLLGLVLATASIGTGWGSATEAPARSARGDPLEPLLHYRPPLASVVHDRHGRVIGQFFVQRRRLVRLDDVPPHLVQAFVASEDGRFFQHGGLDVAAILRALWTNLRDGRIEQGASTITQQMVKNVLLTPDRTWTRKLREMLLAVEVERRLSKEEILLIYLNHIYLGNGSYGIGDAARSYFGKDVSEVDLSEAALLAGLPQRPSAYSPVRHPEAAEARRRYVLERMLEQEAITPEEHRLALAQPPRLQLQAPGGHSQGFADWFTEEVRRELLDWLGPQALYRGGLRIETTLDAELQRQAHRAVRRGLEALDRRQGWRGPLQRVEPEALEQALAEIGRQNRALRAAPSQAAGDEGEPWLGLVLAVETDAQGRELARVGLGPDTEVRAEVDPAAWGLPAAPPGPETRVLRVGDVARFALPSAPFGASARLYQEPRVEGALLSLEIASGDVLAMVGGYDFGRSEFNRAVQARRQPGSAFKPFVYAAAIEAGWTQASLVLDSPHLFWDASSKTMWRPRNYGRRFLGWLTLRSALAQSVNNATIQLARRVGVERVARMARRLGIDSELRANLSLALGTSDVSLLELTRAYAAFPAGGEPVRPRFVRRVLDPDGRVVIEDLGPDLGAAARGLAADGSERAVSPQVARVVTDLLQGAVLEPGATGARARELGRPVAGKTGTTNGNRDAWFLGFSPDVATGVWVGFDLPRSLGPRETGGRAALPIWVEFMAAALATRPEREFELPEGIVLTRVDSRTGRLAGTHAAQASWQAFLAGSEPTRFATRRREVTSARRELLMDAF
jgi:penicillin-binding protein 1A